MKTHLLSLALAGIVLAATNSYAQDAENSNPYAIFGCTPYVAGEKDYETDADKVFVIENFTANSPVARIEHSPRSGHVQLLDKHGKLLKEKLLKVGENGWLTQDRFAEKYYSISPYAFCAGNPIRYIDIKGDSINVAAIISYDTNNGTNYLQTIMNDLSSQTGLTYSVSSTGMLVCQTDSEGNAVVATDANGNQLGSATARNLMTGAIGATETAFGSIHTGYNGSGGGGGSLALNPNQIGDFITGAMHLTAEHKDLE